MAKFYQKYIILDAETNEPKTGKYFVLKLNSDNENERKAVKAALKAYSDTKCDDELKNSIEQEFV